MTIDQSLHIIIHHHQSQARTLSQDNTNQNNSTKPAAMSTSPEKPTTAESIELTQPTTTTATNPNPPPQEQTQRDHSTNVLILLLVLFFAYLCLAAAFAPRLCPFLLAAVNFPVLTALLLWEAPAEREGRRRSTAQRVVDMWCVWPAFEDGNPWFLLSCTLALNGSERVVASFLRAVGYM
jgi:hypothetical protein